MALFKLAQHQSYASQMMENCGQLAIFYEAGTGKTMCALDYLYNAFKNGEIENALIVCPASIVSNWRDSIEKMIKFRGYTAYGIRQMQQRIEVRSFQRTYERKESIVHKRDGSIAKKKILKVRTDINHEWGSIIIDESQGLGAHDSIQTKTALQLATLTDRRFIMTGTPVSGGGGQEDFKKLYGQLKFLNPELWANYKEFCEELVTGFDFFGKPNGYRIEQCRELMKNYGIVARLESCYDMPSIRDITIDVEMGKEATEVYRDLMAGRTAKYGIEFKTGGSRYIKLLEATSGFLKKSEETDDEKDNLIELPYLKPRALNDILQSTDDKVVVFANFRYSIDRAARVCRANGETVVYDGRSNTETWREFQYGKAKYLVCQYLAGGVGLDLFASHTIVFYEPTTSSTLLEQAKARIFRKGQTKNCLYYWISTKGTIEQKAMETVRNGVDVTRDMLDKWAKDSQFALSPESGVEIEEEKQP